MTMSEKITQLQWQVSEVEGADDDVGLACVAVAHGLKEGFRDGKAASAMPSSVLQTEVSEIQDVEIISHMPLTC